MLKLFAARSIILPDTRTQRIAVLQALFVTFLWSTSWVLIKVGLVDIPAVTFAGLRYSLAFLCLLPFALRQESRASLHRLTRPDWARLIMLGLLFYAITQGAMFLGLYYLPAATVTLLMNLTSIVVAVLGILLLSEHPTKLQWLGVGLFITGSLIYFYPIDFPSGEILGLSIVGVGIMTNALSSILGRRINREAKITPLLVTTISMGVGALALLSGGIIFQGMPALQIKHWLIIVWLAVINTAFAFTLWNRTLRTLTAVESSVINNTMLVQTVILAWIFLGESLTWWEVIGILVAGLGALVVQLQK
jgi:drug/metabolite transporter (DMT)-like permease